MTATTFESDWVTVTQERIDQFAEATEDRQWIHVDAERAARESPYGTTIAHGMLTLSLAGHLLRHSVVITGVRAAVNYGLNRVRFTAPVAAGARIRGRFNVLTTEPAKDGLKVTWRVVVEDEARTVLVADWIVLYLPERG